MTYAKCTICNKSKSKSESQHCRKCAGKIHSKMMKGNKFAITTGVSLTIKYCIDCGKIRNDRKGRSKRCYSCENKRKHKVGILNIKGKNNPMYIDGRFKDPYPEEFDNKLKIEIRKRDKFICQYCEKNGFDVHHIDYDKFNIKKMNLITLCDKCHARTNANRDYWYT